ncbi:MAG: hypothetical protein ACLU3I_16065 [Acutalibacteraceae bacterium]
MAAAEANRSCPLTLVGLGDVGGTALLALELLGHEFSRIQIFDPNKAQCARYELELNQVLSPDGQPLPEIVICEEKDLFACDLFAFTASRGVPGLDTAVKDVRGAQYEGQPRHGGRVCPHGAQHRLHRPVLPDLRPGRPPVALCFSAKAIRTGQGV